MAWKALNRGQAAADDSESPLLDEAMRAKIRSFFPRYPSKRAALLPALHIVQEKYGHISHRAMRDVAELLEISPADVLGTLSFYTHFWQHPKGRKVIVLCRSLSCELMGASAVKRAIMEQLDIDEHGTTSDGEYSLVTEECLGACEHAPCLLINERLHRGVKPGEVAALLADAHNDAHGLERSDLYDPPADGVHAGGAA